MDYDDPFRREYTPMDPVQKALIQDLKDAAMELYELMMRVDSEYDARCGYIARTHLEEAVMWAVKGVTGKSEKS